MADNRPKRTDVLHLEVDQLEVLEDFNVRVDLGDLESLGQSIIHNGIKMPIRGYKSGKLEDGRPCYAITDGHRRFAAYQLVYKKLPEDMMIPFIAEPEDYSDVDRNFDLIVANTSEPLTLLEEARVYRRLVDMYQVSQAAIAKRVGKSKMHVSNCLLLLTAPDKLLKQVENNQVAASTVIEMLKQDDKEIVADTVDKAVKDKGGKKVSKKDIRTTPSPATSMEKEDAKESKKVAPVVIEDNTKKKLSDLLATLEAQDVPRKKVAFDALAGIIQWLNGKKKAEDLAKLFFDNE